MRAPHGASANCPKGQLHLAIRHCFLPLSIQWRAPVALAAGELFDQLQAMKLVLRLPKLVAQARDFIEQPCGHSLGVVVHLPAIGSAARRI
jgi:hypothetical protein